MMTVSVMMGSVMTGSVMTARVLKSSSSTRFDLILRQ